MSRPEYNPKQIFEGTGDLNTYSFDFKITNKQQLLVIAVDDQGEEYERVRGDDLVFLADLTFDPKRGGGTVTLQEELPTAHELIVLLADDSPVQDYDFKDKSSFTLGRFEDALDNLAGAIQRLAYRAKQAFRLHDLDNEEEFNTQLPPGIKDQAHRVFQVNADATGIEFGPRTDEIANAQQYALDAQNSANRAEGYADEAEESKDIAEDAANEAQYLLFDGAGNISFPMSPVQLNDGTYRNKIISVNATEGDIVINLDPISTYIEYFKVQFMRTDDSPYTVTIVPALGETIDLQPNFELGKGIAVILSIGSPVNWIKKFIGISSGGSSLPDGGLEGEYLENDGTEAKWISGRFEGFSARFNTSFSSLGVRDTLLKILNFSYLPPQVSLSASGSGTIREKGTPVTTSNLIANVTKRTDSIARIRFLLNSVEIEDLNPPSNTGSGSTSYSWSGSFSDNSTFRVEVTDDGTSGGPTTVGSNVNFTFVYPYFHGCRPPSATGTQVAALTKSVITSNANLTRAFTASAGDVFYFAYPKSYGALSSIKDSNGFETLPSWTQREENIVGLDTTSQTYYIYEFNNIQAAGSASFTFIR